MANEIEPQGGETIPQEPANPVEPTEPTAPTEPKEPVKDKRTPEEELAYYEGRAKRIRKDLGIAEPEIKKSKKSSEVDYGMLAYFEAKGIPEEDHSFVEEAMKDTGKTAKELLSKPWFQADLKERRETRASANAVPKGTPRSGQSAKDTLEYWTEKYNGGMAIIEVPDQFRSKVLNAKLSKEKSSQSNFSSNPIII